MGKTNGLPHIRNTGVIYMWCVSSKSFMRQFIECSQTFVEISTNKTIGGLTKSKYVRHNHSLMLAIYSALCGPRMSPWHQTELKNHSSFPLYKGWDWDWGKSRLVFSHGLIFRTQFSPFLTMRNCPFIGSGNFYKLTSKVVHRILMFHNKEYQAKL